MTYGEMMQASKQASKQRDVSKEKREWIGYLLACLLACLVGRYLVEYRIHLLLGLLLGAALELLVDEERDELGRLGVEVDKVLEGLVDGMLEGLVGHEGERQQAIVLFLDVEQGLHVGAGVLHALFVLHDATAAVANVGAELVLDHVLALDLGEERVHAREV